MATIAERIADARAALNRGELEVAGQLFNDIADNYPDEPDVWNGLGAVAFETGDAERSLAHYSRAKTLAIENAYGGAIPKKLEWQAEHKPLLRAMHGIGLSLMRSGKTAAAKKAFEELLALNPDDNQGVRYLLEDVKAGKNPWGKAKKK